MYFELRILTENDKSIIENFFEEAMIMLFLRAESQNLNLNVRAF